MVSANVSRMIPQIRSYLSKQPVEKAWLFGSASRGEENAKSDIDLLVRYDSNATITLFTISEMMLQLKDIVGRDVDLVEEGRLLPFAEKTANHDKILIYERAN